MNDGLELLVRRMCSALGLEFRGMYESAALLETVVFVNGLEAVRVPICIESPDARTYRFWMALSGAAIQLANARQTDEQLYNTFETLARDHHKDRHLPKTRE